MLDVRRTMSQKRDEAMSNIQTAYAKKEKNRKTPRTIDMYPVFWTLDEK